MANCPVKKTHGITRPFLIMMLPYCATSLQQNANHTDIIHNVNFN